MKQATVNPLADIGVQPATLQSGLTRDQVDGHGEAHGLGVLAGRRRDCAGRCGRERQRHRHRQRRRRSRRRRPPRTAAPPGLPRPAGAPRGASWTPVSPGSASIMVRATDDSANIGSTVTVPVRRGRRPDLPVQPVEPDGRPPGGPDPDAVGTELGTRFRSDVSGTVSGIRFYKQTSNAAHTSVTCGRPPGRLLATVTFAGETASGWQQAAASGATGVATTAPVSAKFSEPVQASTVQMQLTPTGGTAVSGSVSFASPGRSPVRRRPWSRRPSQSDSDRDDRRRAGRTRAPADRLIGEGTCSRCERDRRPAPARGPERRRGDVRGRRSAPGPARRGAAGPRAGCRGTRRARHPPAGMALGAGAAHPGPAAVVRADRRRPRRSDR